MLTEQNKTLIIAEAGVNHNGDPSLAKKLIDVAAEAGADIVKFQTFRAEELSAAHAPKAEYQKHAAKESESQRDMLRRLELGPDMHHELMRHCDRRGIRFLSTPFDLGSVNLLASLRLGLWKIPSGEITNLPYLRTVGRQKDDVLLSTGMSTLEEVGAALDILAKAGTPLAKITLLHCTTEYPAPFAEVNLRAMSGMRRAFPAVAGVGYSDHTPGLEVALAAVALGATVLEKHFTLDRALPGPDHRASLEPEELHALCRAIRNVEKSLGDGVKKPTPSELPNRTVARKSLVAARNIRAGERLSEENLTVKRPGTGISPLRWDALLGTAALSDLDRDECIPLHWDARQNHER